jgi:RNA polymerase sigma-70 factor, ECF subfamily
MSIESIMSESQVSMNHHAENMISDQRDEAIPSAMTQDFLRLYSLHQRRIHAFIGAFFLDSADIDEVLQETSIVLWNKFAEFRPDGNFLSWAFGIARFEVMRQLRLRSRKSSALPLDESLIEILIEERERAQPLFESRNEALKKCLEKLRQSDRKLIEDCYRQDTLIKTIADKLNRPVNAVYQSLSRIRKLLQECISRAMKAQEI